MTITKVTVNVLANRQRLRGVASVVFDDCLKVRDILILPKENNGSLYIAMPNKKIADNHFISLAYPVNAEFRDVIEKAVLEEYQRQLEQGAGESASEASDMEDDV